MVRPAHFNFNEETAVNNAFQVKDSQAVDTEIQILALAEFDAFVKALTDAGVDVVVAPDSRSPVKPDAVFPNNWISFHSDGSVFTYPMFSSVRRLERDPAIESLIEKKFVVNRRIHLEQYESIGKFWKARGV